MTREQFKELKNKSLSEYVALLSDKSDHTLIYGYTFTRDTFHAYLKGGRLFRIIYDNNHLKDVAGQEELSAYSLLNPVKRVCPETCDSEFCKMIELAGTDIPYTTYNDEREHMAMYGKTAEDFD